ncbi:MAG: YigZ family protein [Muribaculum sp.]|nr:YigZ family protein [Muribaculum sp.]
MADSFKTIDSPSEGIYKEKMSKFLAFAHPVYDVTEAKSVLAQYQRKYHDARHVCWAYMLGASRTDFQCNDNGEPSGTAGKPILGQINSFGLTNIIIIVVRYFGGIKLGTGGLTVAYKEAARMAIENAQIVEGHEMTDITFSFSYIAMNDVMKIVKNQSVDIISQQFDNSCFMTVRTPSDNAAELIGRLSAIDSVSIC